MVEICQQPAFRTITMLPAWIFVTELKKKSSYPNFKFLFPNFRNLAPELPNIVEELLEEVEVGGFLA